MCDTCRRGDIVNCQNPVIPGITVDGGYAEMMIAETRGLASNLNVSRLRARKMATYSKNSFNPAHRLRDTLSKPRGAICILRWMRDVDVSEYSVSPCQTRC